MGREEERYMVVDADISENWIFLKTSEEIVLRYFTNSSEQFRVHTKLVEIWSTVLLSNAMSKTW